MTLPPLLAADWEVFFKLIPLIIGLLFWAISHFAGQAGKPAQQPQPRRPAVPPPEGAARAEDAPLQAEIDQFLREAQARREGRPAQPPQRPLLQPPVQQPQRAKQQRRPQPGDKQSVRREQRKPQRVPQLSAERVEASPPRESVAEHVARQMDSSKFAQRAEPLSRMQQESDNDFQQHMQRVFDKDSAAPQTTTGIFSAAAASAATDAAAVATLAASAPAGAAALVQRRAKHDIALFLAGKKNIRDAIVLSEILNRPSDRW